MDALMAFLFPATDDGLLRGKMDRAGSNKVSV